MGLLLGSCADRVVVEAVPLSRSDKRPDRVEVSAEQLAHAITSAEERDLKVIGWYHSHPHITAAPSHVDARTQGEYQTLDDGFVGLICAVFQDALFPSIKVVGFQSEDASGQPGGFVGAGLQPPTYDDVVQNDDDSSKPLNPRQVCWKPREIPVRVLHRRREGGVTSSLRALAALQDKLFEEELEECDTNISSSLLADAVFQKGVANVANNSLHPLIHVVKAKLAIQTARRDRLIQLSTAREENFDD